MSPTRFIVTKRTYLLLAVILVTLLHLTDAVRKAEARLTATIYVTALHQDRKLQYERLEFETHFGEYIVTYRDPNGHPVGIMVRPKYFPFIVSFDPLNESR